MNHQPEVTGYLPTYADKCYQGLRDGEGTNDLNHKSKFKSIVNVFVDPPRWDWEAVLRSWLDSAGFAIDMPAIDHYPQTYTPTLCDDWSPLDTLFQIMKDYNKEGAIMETGYSSFRTPWEPWIDENTQAAWVSCALVFIRERARTHADSVDGRRIPLLLGNFYELVDGNTYFPYNPLDHFGLLRSYDLSEKPAYPQLRAMVTIYEF